MIQPFSRARDITGGASPFVPATFAPLWPRSAGDAAWRRADHAWSDLSFPDLGHPWRDAIWPERARRQASKFRQCSQRTTPSCQRNVTLLSICVWSMLPWEFVHLPAHSQSLCAGESLRLC